MALKLIKNEIVKEIEAVKCFINMAIEAQQAGYTKVAKFFLSEAKEDCEHAFLYAKELDKYQGILGNNKEIVDITKEYYELEYGAVDRISEMYKEAKKEDIQSIIPFISSMMTKHSEDAYRAKKLLQKIDILSSDALAEIEELFDNTEHEN